MRNKIIIILTCLLSFIAINGYAVTPTTDRPRIFLKASEVAALQTRCTTAGQAKTEYDDIKTWVDAHIIDNISAIPDLSENNLYIHLLRTSLVYKVSGTATYGQKVADLLAHIVDTSSRDTYWGSPLGGGAEDKMLYTYASMAIGFDWCYDQIDYNNRMIDIISHINAMVKDAVIINNNYLATNAITYKTEENWFGGVLALAIYGEAGVDTEITTAIERFENWVKEWLGHYTDSGWDGGMPFHATYGVDQVTKYSGWYMEELRTSTDSNLWTTIDSTSDYENLGDGVDFTKNMMRRFVLNTDAGGYITRRGMDGSDNGVGYPWHWETPGWTVMSYLFASRYQDAVVQRAHDIASEYRPDYFRSAYYKDRAIRYFLWCLWHDPSLTASYDNADNYTYWEGSQEFAWRSGFTFNTSSTDIIAVSSSAKKHIYNHWNADHGHFSLSRGVDSLLINSGRYNYGEVWSTHFDQHPWSHNTITVNDADFISMTSGSSGGNFNPTYTGQDSQNDWGEISRHSEVDGNYAYAEMDISNSYNDSTATKMIRSVVFVDDKWMVIYDSITKANASHQTKIHWQMMPKPTATPIDFGTISGNIADITGTEFNFTVASSTLYANVLSPAGVVLRQVGTTASNRCFDEVYTDRGSDWDGWRVEVLPPSGSQNDRVLTVLQPVATSGNVTTSVLTVVDDNYIGTEIRDTIRSVVLFSVDGTNQESASFTTADTTGTVKAVVVGLNSGTYTVNGSGAYPVDANGVLYFSADLSVTSDFIISSAATSVSMRGNVTIQ